MKKLLPLLLSLCSLNALAQWNNITNLTGTTATYNGVNVTVSSAGGVTTGGGCGGLYWTPQSNDAYIFDFSSPVAGVRIEVDAVNTGESVEFYINGVMFPILDCNLDANPWVNNCSVGNCNIVNGQFVNNTTYWVCGGVLTFYGPISTLEIREPIGGSGSTYNVSFAPSGTSIGGCIVQSSNLDSFTSYANKTCAGPSLTVITANYVPGSTVQTWFGDGIIDTSTVLPGNTNQSGYAYINHEYASSGNYNLKQVLYDGTNAVDSMLLSYDHLFCTHVPVQFYNDVNANCVYDNGDSQPNLPILVEVDSNSVAIDTLSTTTGLYYKAYGNPGDVYDLKIIELVPGLTPTCPSTGEISLTLQNLVYYNSPNYMGLGCSNGNNFDLGITATLITAANMERAYITATNWYCLPQNGVLTMDFSPQYTFSYSNPAPTSQVGNSVTWNLNNMSSFFNNPDFIVVQLYPTGSYLTVGDTVQTHLSITPTTGDVNTANNIIISDDTVTGPYDPNAIIVSPAGCVAPGTRLSYTVTFENLGNDTAHSIYVMDTLSAGLDMQNMKIISASHQMNVTKLNNGGYNILKFEFPNINLLGINSPDRHGMVKYSIDMQNNWPIGSSVTNKAGIYFDYMPAVLTNVSSTEACWPTMVNNASANKDNVRVFPNPATDVLSVQTNAVFSSYTISNSVGQVMMQELVNSKEVTVDIHLLPAGLYYINVKGDKGNELRKFVKK